MFAPRFIDCFFCFSSDRNLTLTVFNSSIKLLFSSFLFSISPFSWLFMACRSSISLRQVRNCVSSCSISCSLFWQFWSSLLNSFFISVWQSNSFSSSVTSFSASVLFFWISANSESICCNSRSFSFALRQSSLVLSSSFNKLSFSWLYDDSNSFISCSCFIQDSLFCLRSFSTALFWFVAASSSWSKLCLSCFKSIFSCSCLRRISSSSLWVPKSFFSIELIFCISLWLFRFSSSFVTSSSSRCNLSTLDGTGSNSLSSWEDPTLLPSSVFSRKLANSLSIRWPSVLSPLFGSSLASQSLSLSLDNMTLFFKSINGKAPEFFSSSWTRSRSMFRTFSVSLTLFFK